MSGATVDLISSDGTPLQVEASGSGVPLILVHGGLNSPRAFDRVLPALTRRYRCLALARRGYGQSAGPSADAATHSFEREAEDVAAVLATLDEPAHLFGHSSGAIVAATAGLVSADRLRSLVLYEPPFPVERPHPDDWLAPAEAALARGDNEQAALIGLRDGVNLPPSMIDRFRADPGWSDRVAAAPAWIREARTVVSLPVGVDHFAAVRTPTLLLTGSNTEPHHAAAVQALHEALPDSRIAVLDGQGHTGLMTASDVLCATVLRFLDRH
jgi:pimeloyl-ACP methyl ester carboxylesterase